MTERENTAIARDEKMGRGSGVPTVKARVTVKRARGSKKKRGVRAVKSMTYRR